MKLPETVASEIARIARLPDHRSFYLYDTSIMAEKVEYLRRTVPNGVEVYYAMKANPHRRFIEAALNAGVSGIEIASVGEARKAIDAGCKPERLIFTGPGKSPEELSWSVANRVKTVHVESLTEAHRLNAICERQGVTQEILVRVNPNFAIHGAQATFSGDSNKMGIDENLYAYILSSILTLPNLIFRGLHVYAASGVLKVEDLLENCSRVFKLARDTEARFSNVKCDIIDFGGGFGIDYLEAGQGFSIEQYSKLLAALIERFGLQDRRFILELGRYLTAESGWYCTEILDVKTSLGKMQVICAGGAHHFRRPVALGINHPLAIVPMQRPKVFNGQERVHDAMVFIGGPLCNTADKLAPKDIYIEHAEIGDIAVFGLAGAYGLSMSHLDFLSHPRPPEVFV
jgi:diaminopimelate decarboxylase